MLHTVTQNDINTHVDTQPCHYFLEGENLDILQMLVEGNASVKQGQSLKEKVDVIYIDPPYNTKNAELSYHDTFRKIKKVDDTSVNSSVTMSKELIRAVQMGDLFPSHSQWLHFMTDRLIHAKTLLSESGVIIISVNDKEVSYLKVLMDVIFGEQKFLSQIVWQGAPSSLSKHTSGGLDYLLIYAKDRSQSRPTHWKKEKPYAAEMLHLVNDVFAQDTLDLSESDRKNLAQQRLRFFIKENRKLMDKGLLSYNKVDTQGRIYSDAMLTNSLYRPNLRYPIYDPRDNNKEYLPSDNGWKLSQATMQQLIDDDLVLFEGRKFPRKKLLLEDYMYALPTQSFKADRSIGTRELRALIGKNNFTFPKNVGVIKEWLKIMTRGNTDAIILDYFAGSGTTLQAVIELNSEDNGNRQCLAITNNEPVRSKSSAKVETTARDIAYPRLKAVISGEWYEGRERAHDAHIHYLADT